MKDLVRAAQTRLWVAIRSTRALRNSELWSWTFAGGHFHVAPFGADVPMPTSPTLHNYGARSTWRCRTRTRPFKLTHRGARIAIRDNLDLPSIGVGAETTPLYRQNTCCYFAIDVAIERNSNYIH